MAMAPPPLDFSTMPEVPKLKIGVEPTQDKGFIPSTAFAQPMALPQPPALDLSGAPGMPPPLDFNAPPDQEIEDFGVRQWTRAKRFGSLLGESFTSVFGDSLPAVNADFNWDASLPLALMVNNSTFGLAKPIARDIVQSAGVEKLIRERDIVESQELREDAMKGGPQSLLDDVLNTTAVSLGKMGGTMILGGGMPVPSLVAMYADVSKEKEMELMADGIPRPDAERAGAIEGLLEVATEYGPLKMADKLLKDVLVAGSPVMKKVLHYFMAEWSGEQVATVTQQINDSIVRGDTVQEFQDKLKRQAAVSALAPVATGAAQVAVMKGAQKAGSLALDAIVKRQDPALTPAPFTPFNPQAIKSRDTWYTLEQELRKKMEERDALDAKIAGMAQHPAGGAAHVPGFTTQETEVNASMLVHGTDIIAQHPDVAKEMGEYDLVDQPRQKDGNVFTKAVELMTSGRVVKPGLYRVRNTLLDFMRQDIGQNAQMDWDAAPLGPQELAKRKRRAELAHMERTIAEIEQIVETMRKKYLPDSTLILSFDHQGPSANSSITGSRGTMWSFLTPNKQPRGMMNINLSDVMTDAGGRVTRTTKHGVAETVVHEFGHALYNYWQARLPPHVSQMLKEAYLADLRQISTQSVRGMAKAMGMPSKLKDPGHEMLFSFEENAANPLIATMRERARYFGGFLRFPEWVASQLPRYEGNRLANTPVGRVLHPLARVMRHFYRTNKANGNIAPNEGYVRFIERVIAERTVETAQEKALKAKLKFRKHMTKMAVNPPQSVLINQFGNIAGGFTARNGGGGGSWLGPRVRDGVRQASDTFNWIIGQTAGFLNIAELNPHIAGLVHSQRGGESYRDATYRANDIKNRWTSRAHDLALSMLKAVPWTKSEVWMSKFNGFVFEADAMSNKLERKLTIDELATLQKKYGVSDKDVTYAARMWEFYRDSVTAVENVRVRQLVAMAAEDKITAADLATELEIVKRDFDALRNRNYMPHTRFGQYVVHARSMRDNFVVNDYYTAKKSNDTVSFEIYENEKDALAAAKSLERQYGKSVYIEPINVIEDDMTQMMLGFDHRMVEHLLRGLKLSDEQKRVITENIIKASPTEGFRKKMTRRKGIPGHSQNSIRVFADYAARFSNFISRMETVDAVDAAIEEMKGTMKDFSLSPKAGLKRSKIINWIERHRDYMMNPGNELAALRAAGFIWYLGAVPKSALVNTLQLPMVAYPYLASQYGDVGAVRELAKGMKDVVAQVTRGKPLSAEEEMMMKRLEGLLNESFASMLGGLQEGSILQKMTGGRWISDEKTALLINQAQEVAGFMFTAAEQFNRRSVALATYRLARAKGDTEGEAIVKARSAIENTQFEYARFNRPELMRGKKSVFFLFQQYVSNMMYFLGKSGQGRSRYLMLALLLGGLQGFPGAEMVYDMVDWFVTKYKEHFGYKNPKMQVRAELREFITQLHEMAPWLPGETDVYMRGLAAHLGPYDISGSVSFGRPIAGTDFLNRENMTPRDKLIEAGIQLSGPLVAIPSNIALALGSDDPDMQRRFEKAMPAAVANLSKFSRWVASGKETDYQGNQTLKFDWQNPQHVAEVVGQAAGFAPSRLTEQRQKQWIVKEAIDYYKGRAAVLNGALDDAIKAGDGVAIERAKAAYQAFKEDIPHPSLMPESAAIKASIEQKATKRALAALGLGTERKYAGFYEEKMAAMGPPIEGTPQRPAAVTPPPLDFSSFPSTSPAPPPGQ